MLQYGGIPPLLKSAFNMTDYQIFDPRFNAKIIGHARLEKLWQGGRWLEGPAYFAAGKYLVFSDIPNNLLMRFDETSGNVSVFRKPSNNTNGNTTDLQGRLLSCEHLTRRVTRTEYNGSITPLAHQFNGKSLNSPNDIVTHSDGSIWFSDPTYGIDSDYEGERAVSEIGASNVYRLTPSAQLQAVVTDRLKPNGLAFSSDEKTLYVSDTGASHKSDHPKAIHRYTVHANNVEYAGIFCELETGMYDGFRLDTNGYLWTSAGTAVHCYAPDGSLVGAIPVGEIVANVCFGGPKLNRLYITAQTSLYAIYLNCNGINKN